MNDSDFVTITRVAAPSPTPLRVPDWEPMAAVHGTGSVLLGPHPCGAQAIVPPAVLTRTPEGHVQDYCETGWRVAVWPYAARGGMVVEAQRPSALTEVGFAAVAQLVEADVQEQLDDWLLLQARKRVRCLVLLVRNARLDAAELDGLRAELDDLLLDGARVFGEAVMRQTLTDA